MNLIEMSIGRRQTVDGDLRHRRNSTEEIYESLHLKYKFPHLLGMVNVQSSPKLNEFAAIFQRFHDYSDGN